ncbi:MAG: metal-dependent transcriptional regulator [Eubacteriaceae bacterium]|nr:metal-dependent transcriptional regulator [Eubacteriaceae bacterium]
MKTGESAENYLETILILSKNKEQVRSIDIVNELEFSRPSVSVAMKGLRGNGLIDINKYGHITLTDEGRKIAESIYERHTIISSWLVSLGVDDMTANGDACKIEHVLSEASFAALKTYITDDGSENQA